MLRTRFAPSPTGDLHVGGAWTALASWALGRAGGGTTVLRLEDIDTPRVVPGSAARIAEDLAWLGLDWDEGPGAGGPHASYIQSSRASLYDDERHRARSSPAQTRPAVQPGTLPAVRTGTEGSGR